MESLRKNFVESIRKQALYKIYQQKRRQFVESPHKSFAQGMDSEATDTFRIMAATLVRQFEARDYTSAAETVAKIRFVFSKEISNLAFDELDDSGVIPEIIDRLGIDMLATNCSIVDNSLQ